MKKIIILVLSFCLVMASVFATDLSELNFQASVGLSMGQSKVEGLEDFEELNEKANGSKIGIGAMLASKLELAEHLWILVDFDLHFASGSAISIDGNVGGSYYFVDNNAFHFGAGAKAGVFSWSETLAEFNTTVSYYDKKGELFYAYKGDDLSFTAFGLTITPFIDAYYDINSMLSVGVTAGYKIAFTLSQGFYANKHTFDIDGLNPSVNASGIAISLYGTYRR